MVFDPATLTDHATYAALHQLATGVSHVIVNGALALDGGEPTGAAGGAQFLRQRQPDREKVELGAAFGPQ